MKRKWFAANGKIVVVTAILALAVPLAAASAPPQQQQGAAKKTPYTLAEYNAFQAANGQTNPQAKVKACDDFVSKFPHSVLLPLIYVDYFTAYNTLKNYPKVMEYADKFLAVPDDKLTPLGVTPDRVLQQHLQALYLRAVAFNQSFNEKDTNATAELTKEQQSAKEGLKVLAELPKPAKVSAAQFEQSKKPAQAYFDSTVAFTTFSLKDYKGAVGAYTQVLKDNPNDAIASFRLGVSYLQLAAEARKAQQPAASPAQPGAQGGGQNPPATATTGTTPAGAATAPPADAAAQQQLQNLYMNGFWSLARSIALKGPGEAQMRSYLRAQMFNYEQPACGSLLDQQVSELIQLAASSPTRPATYSIPSAAQLTTILQSTNLLAIMNDLETGGDKASQTWLAVCGQEIPGVVGKIIAATPGTDSVNFQVFTAATGQEIMAGKTANLDVTVEDQPEAARLKKGDQIKFTGTLKSYDAQPFLVHFDKCKVDPAAIPPAPKTPERRRPHRAARGRGRG